MDCSGTWIVSETVVYVLVACPGEQRSEQQWCYECVRGKVAGASSSQNYLQSPHIEKWVGHLEEQLRSLSAAFPVTFRSETAVVQVRDASEAIWSSGSSSCSATGQSIQFSDAAAQLDSLGAMGLLAADTLPASFRRFRC